METEKRKRYTGWIDRVVLTRLFIAALVSGTAPSLSQNIIEETLAPVTTLTEISRNLEFIERNFRELDPGQMQSDLNALRRSLDPFLQTETPETETTDPRPWNILDRFNMVEGASNFYHNRKDDARKAFEDLLRRSPGAALDSTIANPDLARFFESIREDMVGFLTVTSTPVQAKINIAGRFLGISPILGAHVPAGDHLLVLSHQGYESREIQVSVEAGKETRIEASLVKASGSCQIMTSPPGITVEIDGNTVGTTEGRLTDHPQLYSEYITQTQTDDLDPESVSVPLLIDYIPVGDHIVRFSANCFKSQTFKIQVELGEFFIPPVVMEPDFGDLTVISHPSGAPVYIENEKKGRTPIHLETSCAGDRMIRIELGSRSEWFDTVTVPSGNSITVQACPRPTLLFLGTACRNPVLSRDADLKIDAWLRQTRAFNRYSPQIEQRFRIRPGVATIIERISDVPDPGQLNWPEFLQTLPATLNDANARLYAIARVEEAENGPASILFLISPGQNHPDVIEFPPGQPPETIPEFIRSLLENPPAIARYWLGLKLVDCRNKLMIVGIDPNGPSASLPVKAGDFLMNLDGKPVSSYEQFREIVEEKTGPDQFQLAVLQGSIQRFFTVYAAFEPLMLPLGDPSEHYNLRLAQIGEMEILPRMQNPAALNRGICLHALGDYGAAITEGYEKCSLDFGPGVSGGTLAFLISLSYSSLGLNDPALAAAKKALDSPYSRAIDPDGPVLNELVKSHLN
ncbi:PEGA domain-containing protein [bacterium]|nr:PEGA domain-containing protein [candidate division CSSED10-310 bacterium]